MAHVPIFPQMRDYDIDLASEPLTAEILKQHDCVLIVTDHTAVDYKLIGQHAHLIVDTRNAMAQVEKPAARIVKA